MSKYQKAAIAVFSVIAVLYAAFLFVLPNVINLNNYKGDIQKIVEDTAKLKFSADNMKIVTTPALHAGVKIDGARLAYPDGAEIASVKSAQVRIKLLPLLLRTLELADITIDSPVFQAKLLESGQFDIAQYITENLAQSQTADTAEAQMPVKISEKLPKIVVKNYDITASDAKSGNEVEIKGSNFLLDKAKINSRFVIAADGGVFVNKNENITYNVKADSFWPEIAPAKESVDVVEAPQIDFINEIVKFSPKAAINADLKIRNHKKGLKIDGFANIDGMSVVLGGSKLPDSYLHSTFKGHEIILDSDVYITGSEKADIKADIINGGKTGVDLNVKTGKISFASLQKFSIALLNSFNVKNELSSLNMNGFIESDFSLKTDLKKFESNGFFKVQNGSIIHKSMPVSIKNIAADVDFGNNTVNIKNAGALVNGSKFDAAGTIDSDSNANITLKSDAIPLNSLYTVFAPADIKAAYDLQSGILTLNAILKGKLENIEPKLSLVLENLKIKDRLNGFYITNAKTVTDITASTDSKKEAFKGEVAVNDTRFTMLNPKFNASIPQIKIAINPKDVILQPFEALLEGSAIKVSGSIKNYAQKPDINITANGNLKTADLNKLLDKQTRQLVSSKGTLPLIAVVSGSDKELEISAQIGSDAQNYFAPVTVKRMTGKNGLLNFSASIKDNVFKINDAGLYIAAAGFGANTKANLRNAQQLAGISGAVEGLDSKVQNFKNLVISIPQPLQLSTAMLPKSSFKTRGRIEVAGRLTSPVMKGFFEVKDADIPEYLTKIDIVTVNFNDSLISADIQNLSINGSPLNIKADASPKFNKIFVINNMEITSTGLDAEKMLNAMETPEAKKAAAQGSPAPAGSSVVFPVKITKGHGVIDKFVMGEIKAGAISSDFTMNNDVVYLKNLKGSAYDGEFSADVSYNLVSTAVKAKAGGKSMNANSVVTAFAAMKDQVKGKLSFNADVSLKGATYEQQMKTLKGSADFKVEDGQLGSIGRIETFLQANNLLSQKFVESQIGALINTIAPYNTGKFDYLKGDLTFSNGWVNLNPVKSSGPHMSLAITGKMNLVNNNADMQILGTVSPEVAKALGPVAELSVDKITALIPKFGNTVSSLLNAYNVTASKTLLETIPALSPAKEGTKSFKVAINGSLLNPPKAVKSFQWLNTAESMQDSQKSILDLFKKTETTGENQSSSTVPLTKEEVKQEVKNQVQNAVENNEKVQKIKQNETVKNLGALYNFYKEQKIQKEAQ